MKSLKYWGPFSFILASALIIPQAQAAKIGEPAPQFSGVDTNGKKIDSANYRGKYVVLEWHNKDCPYVKTQYQTGNMQRVQKEWTDKGVIWLSIVSSAPKAQGYVSDAQGNEDLKQTHSHVTAMVLDQSGVIGHAFDAKTTPHLFIIDPKGTLIYNGAIDASKDHDSSDVNEKTENYVSLALNESRAGKPVSHPTTKPFGCSVKY